MGSGCCGSELTELPKEITKCVGTFYLADINGKRIGWLINQLQRIAEKHPKAYVDLILDFDWGKEGFELYETRKETAQEVEARLDFRNRQRHECERRERVEYERLKDKYGD